MRYLDTVGVGAYKSAYMDRPGGTAKPDTAASAAGLMARVFAAGWGANNPAVVEGVFKMTQTLPAAVSDPEYLLFATHLIHTYDVFVTRQPGELPVKEWKDWRPKLEEVLGKAQVGDGPNRGSWRAADASVGKAGGRLATTCTLTLALEVSYRRLPLFRWALAPPPGQGDKKPDDPRP